MKKKAGIKKAPRWCVSEIMPESVSLFARSAATMPKNWKKNCAGKIKIRDDASITTNECVWVKIMLRKLIYLFYIAARDFSEKSDTSA